MTTHAIEVADFKYDFERYNKNNKTKFYSSYSTPVGQAFACLLVCTWGTWTTGENDDSINPANLFSENDHIIPCRITEHLVHLASCYF